MGVTKINFCSLTRSESLHPLGGRWRVAPDEGYLGQNAAVLRPHQSPAVTASPDRGKPSCGKLVFVVGHSLHLQSAPSYAILMNRIRSCLLTRFVHSDRLSAPAQDFFWLYCTIPGKKLPPQKSRFWGAIPKKFLGVWGFPLKKSPQKAPNWGDFGAVPPKKQAAAALPVPVFPLWLQCAERSHDKWNEGHF